MYELFAGTRRRFIGQTHYPQWPFLHRQYVRQVNDIQQYYRRRDKRVDSKNRFGILLLQLPRRWDLDDARYVRYIEDSCQGAYRALGMTSALHKGRIFEDGVTLGPKCDEIILVDDTPFEVQKAKQAWGNWAPFRYLYHSRWDLGMPIPNNTTPGKGFGVGLLNIPMLALQYRYWLKYQNDTRLTDKETVYQFLAKYVLPNALESYLDIAFFNRLERRSQEIGNPKFSTPHPFYLSDYSQRVDDLADQTLSALPRHNDDLMVLLQAIPGLLNERLIETLKLPDGPVNRQNEWAIQLALFPYLRFGIRQLLKGRHDQADLNRVYRTLYEAQQDNLFSGMGSPECVRFYRLQLNELLEEVQALR